MNYPKKTIIFSTNISDCVCCSEMADERNPKLSNSPKAIFWLLLLLQFPNSEAVFIGKESCGFESSEFLDISSKMWIMSGPEPSEASTSVSQKLYFPPHSVFKVSIKKDNITVIEAQHPHLMMYRFSNVSQLQFVSGLMTVSCLNDRRRAEKELGVVETATNTPSEFSSETDQSFTPLPEDVTSTTVKQLRPMSFRFEDSSNNSSSSGMQNATSHHVESTTVKTTLQKETTKQALLPAKPVTPNTTTVKVSTTSPTRKTSVETKPAAATTPFVVSEPEEEKWETEIETSSLPVNIPTTPVVSLDKEMLNSVPATETSEAQTTTVGSPSWQSQSHSSIYAEPESSSASFKVEDHIPYFAACGVLLLITVVVAATICIVQRRRSRRRSLDNHEDLFITSTYDEMLLRNNENIDGRSSRVMMYGDDQPVAIDPCDLEVRILGDNANISTNDDERPRCLGDE